MRINGLGGEPCMPTIQFTGIQFQRILDIVRDRLTEWIANFPDPPEAAAVLREDVVVQVEREANQPSSAPAGLRGFLGENKSWIFQGIRTESMKCIERLLTLLFSFAI